MARTVTVQKVTRSGRVLTQKIDEIKWQAGRQSKNLRGNPWERSGWSLVTEKKAAEPVEAKPAKKAEQ